MLILRHHIFTDVYTDMTSHVYTKTSHVYTNYDVTCLYYDFDIFILWRHMFIILRHMFIPIMTSHVYIKTSYVCTDYYVTCSYRLWRHMLIPIMTSNFYTMKPFHECFTMKQWHQFLITFTFVFQSCSIVYFMVNRKVLFCCLCRKNNSVK